MSIIVPQVGAHNNRVVLENKRSFDITVLFDGIEYIVQSNDNMSFITQSGVMYEWSVYAPTEYCNSPSGYIFGPDNENDTIVLSIPVIEKGQILECGDIDGDGIVDNDDYVLMKYYLYHLISGLCPMQTGVYTMDTNGDGNIAHCDAEQLVNAQPLVCPKRIPHEFEIFNFNATVSGNEIAVEVSWRNISDRSYILRNGMLVNGEMIALAGGSVFRPGDTCGFRQWFRDLPYGLYMLCPAATLEEYN